MLIARSDTAFNCIAHDERLDLLRAVQSTKLSALIKTLACTSIQVVAIVSDSSSHCFDTAEAVFSRLRGRRPWPLWIKATDPSQSACDWLRLPATSAPQGVPDPRAIPLKEMLGLMPNIPAEDFLNACLIESADGDPHGALDALNESIPNIHSDILALFEKLRERTRRRHQSVCAEICHSLQGVLSVYGDIQAHQLLGKWLPALRTKSKLLTESDLVDLEELLAQSLRCLHLYQMGLNLEVEGR